MQELNPYEPPSEPPLSKPWRKSSFRKTALLVVLGILCVPSSLLAGFATCWITIPIAAPFEPGVFLAGLGPGLMVGVGTVPIVLGLFIYGMIRLYRSM